MTSPDPSPPAAFAASHAQHRLWVLYKMDPASTAYSLPGAIMLDGPLDSAAFRAALQTLVDRHESLRTTFGFFQDQVCQFIHPAGSVSLTERDLRLLPDPPVAAGRLVAEEAARPFDLQQGPLFRAELLCLAGDRHLFVYNLHHIITDEASKLVLVRELGALYSAHHAGARHTLPELDYQYKDFAAWQNEQLTGEGAGEHRKFWLERFAGDLPLLKIETDYPRPHSVSSDGRTEAVRWEGGLRDKLEALARRERTTLFLVLLTLVRVQLFRYTGQNDLIIGTPVVGRGEPELEDLIGFFANTLPLRQTVSEHDTFRTLLQREKERFAEAYDHQIYPFDQLVNELQLRREVGRAPVFEASVHLQNLEAAELQLGAVRISPFPVETIAAKLDLSYDFISDAGGLHCALTYKVDLFAPERILRMLGHLRQLAEHAVNDPVCRISEMDLLTPVERRQLLHHPPAERTESSIVALFEAVVERQPHAPALVTAGTTLTFAELNARANQLARHLQSLGIGRESCVGVYLERSAEWVIALLATLKAGAIYFPLEPAHPFPRIAQLLEDARPALVVTTLDLEQRLPATVGCVVHLGDGEDEEIAAHLPENPSLPVLPAQVAYLIYTSGSTGKPKGVLVEHRGFANMIRDQIDRFEVGPADRGLQCASVSFDASLYELFLALLAGAAVGILPRLESGGTGSFREFVTAHGMTMATLPPSFARGLEAAALASLRLLITAGEAAVVETSTQAARHSRCVNAYGPTEASVCVSCHQVDPDGEYPAGIPIGQALSRVHLYILDATLTPVPAGVIGELYVGGIGVARGYLRRPELTAAAFIPDPFSNEPGARLYRTGDLARWQLDGEILFTGRCDYQVKVRGHRLELGEIEAALLRLSEVTDAAARVASGPDGNLRLLAYVVMPEKPLAPGELRMRLLAALPPSHVPDLIIEVTAIPRNSAGKIDRHALSALSSAPAPVAGLEPSTDLEHVLAGIYMRVLDLKRVSVDDSFFDLGGNSLLAMRVLSAVREFLRVEPPLSIIFESPRIDDLARHLLRDSGADVPLERIAAALLKYERLSESEKAALQARSAARSAAASPILS